MAVLGSDIENGKTASVQAGRRSTRLSIRGQRPGDRCRDRAGCQQDELASDGAFESKLAESLLHGFCAFLRSPLIKLQT